MKTMISPAATTGPALCMQSACGHRSLRSKKVKMPPQDHLSAFNTSLSIDYINNKGLQGEDTGKHR